MDSGFDDKFGDEVRNRKAANKRKDAMESEVGTGLPDAERQRAWLQRTSDSTNSWRPLEMHRLSARKWVYALDNQLKVSTCHNGLDFFCWAEGEERWGSWREWPGLGVALDMGSDGVAGYSALARHFDCNIWMWPDPSHMCQRTMEAVLKETKLFEFWCLLLITFNLEHGPHRDQGRRNQLRDGLAKLFETRSPEQCPLFEQMSPEMAQDLEEAGILQFSGEESREATLWEWLKSRSRHGPMGRRVSMCRFGGMQHAAMSQRPYWTVNLFERTLLALEQDMLRGKKFEAKLTLKAKHVEGASGSTTNPTHLQLDDRALRGCCENAVVVSILTLDDADHRRVVDCVLTAQAPLDKWHTEQNRTLRSTESTRGWLLQQVSGAYRANVQAFIAKLFCLDSLVDAGFFLLGISPGGTQTRPGQALDNHELIIEDEYAELYAGLMFGFVTQRVSRGFFYDCWPTKMIGALAGESEAARLIEEFQDDQRIFGAFEVVEGKGAIAKAVLKRHVMSLRSVKQFSAAFEETGFCMSDGFKTVLEHRARTNVQTQIIEDFNGAQRGASESKQGRRFRKPSVCMATCLSQDIIGERHHFLNPPCDAPGRHFDSCLPKSAFVPDRKKASADFSCIASTAAAPTWWSPSPANLSLPYADLALLRSAEAAGSFHVIERAGLGQILTSTHKLAVRTQEGGSQKWWFCVHAFPKSAVLLWPAKLEKMGDGTMFLEPVLPIDRLSLKGIFSLEPGDIMGVSFVWRSWAWQVASLPKVVSKAMKPAIRAFVSSHGIRSIQELACLAGWWSCSRATVVEYARYFGISFDPALPLIDVLWETIKASLQCTDEQALACLHMRLAKEAAETQHSEALLEIDEALEVADPMDKNRIEETKKESASKVAARKAFREHYIAKAKVVNEEAANKKKRRTASGTSSSSRPAPKRPIPHHCSQPEAKRLVPTGASIWRSCVRNEWCGHFPPCKRVTMSFTKWGSSEEALRQCLKTLWSQYLDKSGKDSSECSVEGLFD